MNEISMNSNNRNTKHKVYSISTIIWDKMKTDTVAKILKCPEFLTDFKQ